MYRMDAEQIRLATGIMIEKICFISGVNVGQPTLFDLMQEEILKFILSIASFNRLTMEEIIVAFRMNAAGTLGERVEHFNRPINCEYVGKVLEGYVKIRQNLERKELYAFPVPHQVEYQPEFDEDKLVENCKMIYYTTKKTGLITEQVYDILVKKGYIALTIEQKQTIKDRIISRMDNEALRGGAQAIRKLKELKSARTNFDHLVRIECKREAVAMHFNQDHTPPKA